MMGIFLLISREAAVGERDKLQSEMARTQVQQG
jgi:hypothetical protein